MDREEVCDSLITWMQTFGISGPCHTAEELSDGVAMAQVLHQIAPDYFNVSWMSKIKTDEVTNWRLKVSNLKKILKGILEYNLEVIGIQIHDFQMPDVNAIGEQSNISEMGRLLQLILGCAVNCDAKQEYIQRIMSMEESVQHVVMNAIQELMTKEITTGGEGDSELAEQLKRTIEDLNGALEAKEELTQRCHELDQQVAALVEEKHSLTIDNERLSERLNMAENLDDPSTPAGKRYQQLQQQVDKLQEENFKVEAGRDDLKIKLDVLAKDYSELKQKNSELMSIAEEARSLKDEVDVLRHTAEQATKYETMIESYKKKLEELSDLRGQVKLLEDKNTKYMQEHLELEEEIRKFAAVKNQLEAYKRQVHELQNKLSEETKRADKSDFEAKRAQDKMTTLQREKERIGLERDSLREMNEEMKLTQLQKSGDPEPTSPSESQRLEMLSLPQEVKEKIMRLEHENKLLKLRTSGSEDEKSPMLQSMLDDANARNNELETELRIANQRIMEVEAQVEDIQENHTATSNEEINDLRKKFNEQIQRMKEKDNAIHKYTDQIHGLETKLSASCDKVKDLQDQIHKKDSDMKFMENKYKKYLEKAKAVFNAIDPKQNAGTSPEVIALKNQLQEKERYIEQLERDHDKAKNIREQEEKFIVSAWYNLGMQLNRQVAEERLSNSSSGQSFLARQRQVHSRRTQSIPNSHPNSAR